MLYDGVIMLEMRAWNPINLPESGLGSTAVVHFRWVRLPLDLGLLVKIANAIEGNIKIKTRLSESPLHTIATN